MTRLHAVALLLGLNFLYSGTKAVIFTDDVPREIVLCEGDTQTFNWSMKTEGEEMITSRRWTRQLGSNGTPEDLVNLKLPAKFRFGRDIDLTIYNLTLEDAGRYTVNVQSFSSTDFYKTKSKSCVLQVTGVPNTATGKLSASINSTAQLMPNGQWGITLSCGPFTTFGQPPVEPEWQTPSGVTVNSTRRNGDSYELVLDTENAQTGWYSCVLPEDMPAVNCLPWDSPLRENASIFISKNSVALSIMLGRLSVLEFTVAHTAYISAGSLQAAKDEVVIFDKSVTNTGNAYAATTGVFTAPADGHYMFLVSVDVDDKYKTLLLKKNGDVDLAKGDASGGLSRMTTGGVFHLVKGDAVTVVHGESDGAISGGQESIFVGYKVR